jgi:hypothetical protein
MDTDYHQPCVLTAELRRLFEYAYEGKTPIFEPPRNRVSPVNCSLLLQMSLGGLA